ncbi:unnamed protein product [Urochloa decumbens]|uniref:Uncharacterized protein n=1 Tax=Urochloa decumbens TaxID=240449 RepID=A0ABC9C152_9POAL
MAAARQGQITTTASRWSPETARGRHVFEVTGYSLLKGLGAGKFIRSATFAVGGYDWCIRFYPTGRTGRCYSALVRREQAAANEGRAARQPPPPPLPHPSLTTPASSPAAGAALPVSGGSRRRIRRRRLDHRHPNRSGAHRHDAHDEQVKRVDESLPRHLFAGMRCGARALCIIFGQDGDDQEYKDYVSVYLELMTTNTEATAIYNLRLVNWVSSDVSSLVEYGATRKVFSTVNSAFGKHKFLKRSVLEASSVFLRDDCLAIECNMAVIMETTTPESEMICDIQVPPSDLLEDLGKLLESEEVADVAFKVDGEVFRAHKFLLALRSPVFRAELYGPMSDKNTRSITVEDMQPAVFKMLLHYIYKDTLPAIDDNHGAGAEVKEAIKHLLVAADRYGIERMKFLCERFLCKTLDAEGVANILALADRHHCNKLKEACIQFINSSNKIDNVISSQGYKHLRSACPAVFVDMWEKSAKSRKIQ